LKLGAQFVESPYSTAKHFSIFFLFDVFDLTKVS